jgi:hypothetical protein
MKPLLPPVESRRARGGWALVVVMVLAVGAILVAGSVLSWSNVASTVTARNNEFYATTYAAEAATEKILSSIISDYENYGSPLVLSKLSTYSAYFPVSGDDPSGNNYWGNYSFSGGPGQSNSVVVSLINPTNIITLGVPYTGLIMNAAEYEIVATAVNKTSGLNIPACVGQQINLGVIPIFQFAIFYQNTMEVEPGPNMTINGFVHGNNNIYMDPNAALTFNNDVSSSGNIVFGKNPSGPSSQNTPSTPPVYNGTELSGVNPLVLPVGTNSSGYVSNTALNVDAILQLPPPGTSATSQTGSNYLFNKADLIILLSNNSVTVTSGVLLNNQATVISNSVWTNWLITNANTQFYDQREGITIQTADLDIGKLTAWSATNTLLRPVIQSATGGARADVNSVYIADERGNSNAVVTTNMSYTTNQVATNTSPHVSYPGNNTFIPPVTTNTVLTTNSSKPNSGTYLGSYTTSNGKYIYQLITGYSYQLITGVVTNYTYVTNYNVVSQAGIVLTNGAVLPPKGLGVATPDPLYIVGNYNVTTNTNGVPVNLGTGNTSQTYPAAVYSDAVTILSSAWNPLQSANGINSRTAANDTVNAAILTGNVPSTANNYSGGVENFPRFLENWNGYTFTYNGSMVCMFSSVVANAPWSGTGAVYNPPTRNWAFDNNFNNPAKQPPLMPTVISVNRGAWTFLQPNSVSF